MLSLLGHSRRSPLKNDDLSPLPPISSPSYSYRHKKDYHSSLKEPLSPEGIASIVSGSASQLDEEDFFPSGKEVEVESRGGGQDNEEVYFFNVYWDVIRKKLLSTFK